MHFIASLTETIPSFTAPIYFRDDIGLKMGKDRSRLGMRKGRKKKNGSTFLDNQKRHRAEVKKSRITKKVKKTDVEEGGEEDAGPRKAFKFQNFSEQVTSILFEFHLQKLPLVISAIFWGQYGCSISISGGRSRLLHCLSTGRFTITSSTILCLLKQHCATETIDQGLERYLWTRIRLPVSLLKHWNTGGISI